MAAASHLSRETAGLVVVGARGIVCMRARSHFSSPLVGKAGRGDCVTASFGFSTTALSGISPTPNTSPPGGGGFFFAPLGFAGSVMRALEKILGNLITLRAPTAHCKGLAEDEVTHLHLSFRDWFRHIE